MANAITTTEYNQIKNITFVVIRFDNNVRTMSYGGLSYIKALDYIMKTQSYNSKHLVFDESNLPKGINLNESKYEHFTQFIL